MCKSQCSPCNAAGYCWNVASSFLTNILYSAFKYQLKFMQLFVVDYNLFTVQRLLNFWFVVVVDVDLWIYSIAWTWLIQFFHNASSTHSAIRRDKIISKCNCDYLIFTGDSNVHTNLNGSTNMSTSLPIEFTRKKMMMTIYKLCLTNEWNLKKNTIKMSSTTKCFLVPRTRYRILVSRVNYKLYLSDMKNFHTYTFLT